MKRSFCHIKYNSTIIATLIVVVLLMNSTSVNAKNNSFDLQMVNGEQSIEYGDTLSYSSEIMKELILKIYQTQSEEASIEATCEFFITEMLANRRDTSYDYLFYILDMAENSDTIQYIKSINEYYIYTGKFCDFNIDSDTLSFKNFKGSIEGTKCSASIQMQYYYQLRGAFDEMCNRNCEYYFEMIKNEGRWYITSVKSTLPDENMPGFEYGAFDAYSVAKAVVSDEDYDSNEKLLIENGNSTKPSDMLLTYNTVSYSASDAISYASTYYNQNNYNTLFGFISGANCQNFVSQCVWAGLLDACGASGNYYTTIPAVSISRVGSNAPNVWCHNQYTSYYSNYTNNWMWDNVNGFIRLIWESNHSQEGPQGYYYKSSHLDNASIGDGIAFDTDESLDVTAGEYDHAMFVTATTGTYGSRDVSNIFIAANTSQTTSAYEPLAWYTSQTESRFCTLHITGGYYNLP